MQKVRLGKTEMMVTKTGFGGIPIQRHSSDKAIEIILHAFNCGVNWCDTAHGYGHSEEVIGKALKQINRESVYVFSKGKAAAIEGMKKIVETSFSRLDLEYIDLYQIHNVTSKENWETMLSNGVLDYLLELKQQGRIRHLGASAHTKGGAFAALSSEHIEVLQWPFNFIVAEDSDDVLEACGKKDAGFIAMKPLGGGMITNGPLCIRYLSRFQDIVLDPGFETTAEIDELVSETEKAGNTSYLEELKQQDAKRIMEIQTELGKKFCRKCEYCSPCAQGVNIPMMMAAKSVMKRMPPQKVFVEWFPGIMETHKGCTECGECETRCPYELPIINEMKENAILWQEAKTKWESA